MKRLITTTYAILVTMTMAMCQPVMAGNTTFEETVLNGIEKIENKINVEKYNLDGKEALNRTIDILTSEPEAWTANSKVSIQTKGKKAVNIIVDYDFTEREIIIMQEYINRIVDDAVSIANTFQTDFERAKAVYGYLIDNYDYDWSLTNTREYDIFKNGTGVCTFIF